MVQSVFPTRVQNAARSPIGGITLAGFVPNGGGVPGPPMRILGSYAVVYLVGGAGRYRDERGLDLRLRAGDLLVIFPDVAHIYGPGPRERWTEFYLCFDGPVFDLWRETGLLDPARPLYHLEPIEHWARRFEGVLGAPRRLGHAPPMLEVCRLQTVLSEALLAGRGALGGPEADWADRACARLASDLERELDLASARLRTWHELRRLPQKVCPGGRVAASALSGVRRSSTGPAS